MRCKDFVKTGAVYEADKIDYWSEEEERRRGLITSFNITIIHTHKTN